MLTRARRSSSSPPVALVGVLLGVMLAAAGATAQPADRPAGRDQARLRAAIEARYRVVPVQDGIVLVPRRAGTGVQSIDLSGGTIGIDGTIVTGAELRQRVPRDADAILQLTYLEPADRRALFGLPGSGTQAPAAGEPPPSTVPAPAPGGEPPAEEHRPPEDTGVMLRRSDARVRIGGDIHIGEDEQVNGAVVAIGGSADVNGRVNDAVVVVLGDLHLGPKADVRGDVTVVGGTLDRNPQARVGGDVNDIGFDFPRLHIRPRLERFAWWDGWGEGMPFFASLALYGTVVRFVLFGILAFLVLLIARRPVERIEYAVASEPWKAGLVGLLAELLFIPVLVLTIVILVISIVGIPLLVLIPFALLALLVALLFGLTAVAYRIGRWMEGRFGWRVESVYMLLLFGLAAVWILTFLGRLTALGGWPVWFLASGITLIGFLVEYIAWTVGFGAVLLTRFGSRGPVLPVAVSPVPPSTPAGVTQGEPRA